ncbi:MAG: cobalamin biosynthesis protein, partial [Candidatus Humimicrobiaceae bacterium]
MDEIFFLKFPLNRIFVLLIAFALDIIFGDPRKMLHPVILMGKAINYFENILLKNKYKRLKGLLLVVLVSIIFTGAALLLTYCFL